MMQHTIRWKLEELDRMLNDPTAPMEAHRVWSLLDDVSDFLVAEESNRAAGAERGAGGS